MEDEGMKSARERERLDQQAARATAKWQEAVRFLRKELAPVADEVRAAIAANAEEWIGPYHFFWGMGVRNLLRTNGFAEADMGVQNLDNIYVPLVEEAMKEEVPWTRV